MSQYTVCVVVAFALISNIAPSYAVPVGLTKVVALSMVVVATSVVFKLIVVEAALLYPTTLATVPAVNCVVVATVRPHGAVPQLAVVAVPNSTAPLPRIFITGVASALNTPNML